MGVLSAILDRLGSLVKKPGSLVITTLISCLVTVILTASQYVAILLPGEIFQDSYKRQMWLPTFFSRTLEDGGTIFSYLVPGRLQPSMCLPRWRSPRCPICPMHVPSDDLPGPAIIYAATGFAVFKTDGSL